MGTRLVSELAVDDPLVMDANYRFGPIDRKKIDDQILASERMLVDLLIRSRLATYVLVSASSATIPVGFASCLASAAGAEPTVTLATTAALGNAKGTFGVALTVGVPGAYCPFAIGGALPKELTGLPSATAGDVRVNGATGALERVAALSGGDYGIGTLDNAGFHQVIPGMRASSGGGASPAGTDGNLQVKSGVTLAAVTPGAVGSVLRQTGANTVAMGAVDLADTDAITGLLPIANMATGTAGQFLTVVAGPASAWGNTVGFIQSSSTNSSSAGLIRLANPDITIVAVRNSGNTNNHSILEWVSASAGLFIGTNSGFTAAQQVSAIAMYATSGGTVALGLAASTYLYLNSGNIEVWVPFGGSQSASLPFRFRNISISKSNTTDLTLANTQYPNPIQIFTGIPTGTFNVIAPNQTGAFGVVANNTSSDMIYGDTSGTGWKLRPGDAVVLYHDGTDYVPAAQAAEPSICGMKLTLTTGVPTTTADVSNATTIYCTPADSGAGVISLWDTTGNRWVRRHTLEISIALGTLTSGKNYDVFAYCSNAATGTVALEFSAAWTNDTTRADALGTKDGVVVKASDPARRHMGTFRTTSTTQTQDTVIQRFLWNRYFRNERFMTVADSTDTWTHASLTYRQANGNTANCFEYVCGDVTLLSVRVRGMAQGSTTSLIATVGVGIDSTTTNSALTFGSLAATSAAGTASPVDADYKGYPVVGYHKINQLEASGTTITWFGDGASPTVVKTGMIGSFQG